MGWASLAFGHAPRWLTAGAGQLQDWSCLDGVSYMREGGRAAGVCLIACSSMHEVVTPLVPLWKCLCDSIADSRPWLELCIVLSTTHTFEYCLHHSHPGSVPGWGRLVPSTNQHGLFLRWASPAVEGHVVPVGTRTCSSAAGLAHP